MEYGNGIQQLINNMNIVLPTIIFSCKQNHKWLCAAPPWQAELHNKKFSCPACNENANGWQWGGMRELNKDYPDEVNFVHREV